VRAPLGPQLIEFAEVAQRDIGDFSRDTGRVRQVIAIEFAEISRATSAISVGSIQSSSIRGACVGGGDRDRIRRDLPSDIGDFNPAQLERTFYTNGESFDFADIVSVRIHTTKQWPSS
jgi:hypothetical protein